MANGLYGNVSKKNLPMAWRVHVHQKMLENKLPTWMSDERIMKRIMAVYGDYQARMTIPQIMAKHEISWAQVYKDISRARQVTYWMFVDEMNHLVMEQVQKRQQVIREVRESLKELKEHTPATPFRASAEAQLYKVVGENEKAIEEIFALRGKDKMLAPQQQIASPEDAVTGSVVIDLTGDAVKSSPSSEGSDGSVSVSDFSDEDGNPFADLDDELLEEDGVLDLDAITPD